MPRTLPTTERIDVRLNITYLDKDGVKTVHKLSCKGVDRKSFTISQSRRYTKDDLRGISEGKPPPVRPIDVVLKYRVPAEEIGRRIRRQERLQKRNVG